MGTERVRIRHQPTHVLVHALVNDLFDLLDGAQLTDVRLRRFRRLAMELQRREDLQPSHHARCVCQQCFEFTHGEANRMLNELHGPFDDPLLD